jgi:hypothetical protein
MKKLAIFGMLVMGLCGILLGVGMNSRANKQEMAHNGVK